MLLPSFYKNNDVVNLAQQLLGKVLNCTHNGGLKSAIITETEAYHQCEKACHAFNGRLTKRTAPLYQEGGSSYVYLCYGIHHLFNVVTGPAGEAAAVLIRAVQPLQGIDQMLQLRKSKDLKTGLTAGPGRLTQALGISIAHNNVPLVPESGIWIESPPEPKPQQVVSSVRIGVDYAEKDAFLPWRFYLKDNPWVSKL